MNLLERIVKLEKAVERLAKRTFIYYDKGTYVPTYLGGTTAGVTTYSFQDGAWTRKGREITVRGQINWTAATGTGNAQVSLPFAAASGNTTGALWLSGVTFAAGTPELRLNSGDSFFTLISPATNAAGTVVAVEAAGTIIWTVSYFLS